MKLEIDIDEKEFGIDIENKFQDFFKRLQAEIQSRLISNDTLVCGVYELETIEMFLTAFKNATIEQELKKGHWRKIHWKAFRCSECKRLSEFCTDFCPNCGADMRGETNE